MVLRKLDIYTSRRLKLDPCLSPCTKINSKWVKDLNARTETLKLLEEIRENTSRYLVFEGSDFLDRTQEDREIRARIDGWDFLKSCTSKEMTVKDNLQNGEKIFLSYSSDISIQNI
jgi:hypothetical protein